MRLSCLLMMVALTALGSIGPGAGADAQTYAPQLFSQVRWRPIGPLRGGRGRAVAGVPSEPNVFYIGNDDGGVWKSTDYGNSWRPIFDQEPTSSIGAIAVSVSDPNVIYVGTGEGNIRPDQTTGMGMYRSADAGKTWDFIGLRETEDIAMIAVDPHDSNRVFVAALGHIYGPNRERGIFRSLDAGRTWKQVLYVNEYTSGDDIEMDPGNPNILYATLWQQQQAPWENGQFGGTDGGIFKSTDGGSTWNKLTNGLPAVQQALLRIAPSDPNILYGSMSSGPGAPDGTVGIYRSNDAGASWHKVTNDPRPAERIGGGDLPVLAIDPKNPDIVYSDTPVLWKSADGGRTWFGFWGAPGGDDYQQTWINPNNPDIMAVNSDQGAIVTVNGGDSWSSWYNQPTAAMYKAGIDNTWPYRVCGGQQDSGSACVSERGDDGELTAHDWHPAGIEEYGPDLTRKTWEVPASVGKYKDSPDAKPMDRGVVYALAPSPLSSNLIWAGTDDGLIWITHDGGRHWSNVTPPQLKTYWRVFSMEASRFDPNEAYAAINTLFLNDMRPHLFRTEDGGRHWTEIDNGIAQDATTNVIRQDPERRGLLFAGTETQVWVSFDNGDHWQSLRLNMPAVSVRDLKVHGDDLIAATHGRGFMVLDDITPMRQMDAQVAQAPVMLYKPETAVRVRWDMNPPTPWRMPSLPNPPPGAIIDYYLASHVSGPVTLDIMDSSGRLVRHFSSADPEKPLEPAKLDIPDWWPRPPMNLSTEAGMHRLVWDMHYRPMPGALKVLDENQAVEHNTPVVPSSPWIMPGNYTVRLTADGRSRTQPLTVEMDPRVQVPKAALQQQLDASMRAYHEAMATSAALGQVRDLEKQIATRKPSAKLASYRKQLEELSGPEATSPSMFFFYHGPPTLGSIGASLQMLMGRMQGADRAPTPADIEALDRIGFQSRSLMSRWEKLRGHPFTELNRSLRGLSQPPLVLAKAVAPADWNAGWITTNRDEQVQ